jgi:hypothetical protein
MIELKILRRSVTCLNILLNNLDITSRCCLLDFVVRAEKGNPSGSARVAPKVACPTPRDVEKIGTARQIADDHVEVRNLSFSPTRIGLLPSRACLIPLPYCALAALRSTVA